MEIQSINGNTITFSTPFHMTFDVMHTAQMTDWDTKPLTNSGLEDVYVSGVPAPGGNTQYNDVVLPWRSTRGQRTSKLAVPTVTESE